jgi:hypothetical protein
MHYPAKALFCLAFGCYAAFAQGVTPAQRPAGPAPQLRQPGMHRLVAIMPWTGAGTEKDPRRPLAIPANGMPAGVAGYTVLSSDDGQLAVVEMWANTRAALLPVVEDKRQGVRVFEPHRHTKAEVEAAVRAVRADFRLGDLPGQAQEVRP